jgi:hypothetical protein
MHRSGNIDIFYAIILQYVVLVWFVIFGSLCQSGTTFIVLDCTNYVERYNAIDISIIAYVARFCLCFILVLTFIIIKLL